jgi:hypothetical protein
VVGITSSTRSAEQTRLWSKIILSLLPVASPGGAIQPSVHASGQLSSPEQVLHLGFVDQLAFITNPAPGAVPGRYPPGQPGRYPALFCRLSARSHPQNYFVIEQFATQQAAPVRASLDCSAIAICAGQLAEIMPRITAH